MQINHRSADQAQERQIKEPWGSLTWLASKALTGSPGMTVGRVIIHPHQHNPRHAHKRCQEVLYLLRGTLRHSVGDQHIDLRPGDTLVVPAGVFHNATNTSHEDADMIVTYDSGERDFVAESAVSASPPPKPTSSADPSLVQVLERQLSCSQQMLANIIEACPDSAWAASQPGIWQHAYHTLLGNAIWLHWPEPAMVFPPFHHEGAGEMVPGATPVYTKAQVQEYRQQVQTSIKDYFARLTDETLKQERTLRGQTFTRADFILGQVRHTQHHVGCMHALLRRLTNGAVSLPPWLGFGE